MTIVYILLIIEALTVLVMSCAVLVLCVRLRQMVLGDEIENLRRRRKDRPKGGSDPFLEKLVSLILLTI